MLAFLSRDAGTYPYTGVRYANPHAVTSVGGTTYTYDTNGSVTAIGWLDYTCDWRNGLASADGGSRPTATTTPPSERPQLINYFGFFRP